MISTRGTATRRGRRRLGASGLTRWALAAGAIAAAAPAHASTLSPARISGQLDVYSQYLAPDASDPAIVQRSVPLSQSGTFSTNATTPGGSAKSSVTIGLSPFPFLTGSIGTSAADDGFSNGIADLSATLTYQIAFVGAEGSSLPVFVRANATFGPSSGFLLNQEGYVNIGSQDDPIASTQTDNGKIDGEYIFQANTIYDVEMHIGLDGGSPNSESVTSAYGSVTVDPYFAIDPAVASQYQLLISPGVGNSPVLSPVPLPGSAPLFGAALLLVGAVGWRLERRSRAAAA